MIEPNDQFHSSLKIKLVCCNLELLLLEIDESNSILNFVSQGRLYPSLHSFWLGNPSLPSSWVGFLNKTSICCITTDLANS